MKVRIVLVEPHEAGNVGAAARAMKNFGFTDLCIVGPDPRHSLDEKSTWWAAGADDVLEHAKRVPSLEDAIADCHLTVATTAVRARQVYEQLTPSDVAQLAGETLGAEHRLGLVFGRETSGLSAREIALCQRTASVPTWPEFPTMNLAQSVAVFCYELGKGLRETQPLREPAVRELLFELERHAREVMQELHFFGDKSPDRIFSELQALAGRAMLTTREASLLLDFIRRVEGRLGERASRPQPPGVRRDDG
jgi:TrmH family RNA methyltransferase